MEPHQPSTPPKEPPLAQDYTRRTNRPRLREGSSAHAQQLPNPSSHPRASEPFRSPHRGTHARWAAGSLPNVLLFPPPLPSGSRPPSRGLQRACAVARAAGCGEGLKSAGHAQRRFWLWRGGRHIGSARGALRAAPGRYGARLAGPHAAAPGPRVAPLRARRAEASGCAVSGRRRGALAGP